MWLPEREWQRAHGVLNYSDDARNAPSATPWNKSSASKTSFLCTAHLDMVLPLWFPDVPARTCAWYTIIMQDAQSPVSLFVSTAWEFRDFESLWFINDLTCVASVCYVAATYQSLRRRSIAVFSRTLPVFCWTEEVPEEMPSLRYNILVTYG